MEKLFHNEGYLAPPEASNRPELTIFFCNLTNFPNSGH